MQKLGGALMQQTKWNLVKEEGSHRSRSFYEKMRVTDEQVMGTWTNSSLEILGKADSQ